ncbi:LysR substrate-binding domain-containing protein [Amycolatopsis rhabdoformis]|uniref:LysR substrate-binding domain-containing protein n=1 Tax=Amycolatopsis rhabdoformis TaxID=1448059 RepID=A0ABZ1ILV4_9PSEU|nr:LysR substrate-binding domain-containing protein [Amycolatopsis rhabdoformis]WSE34549.1 LysR substrate-binding domain-containing protein [Amycolatopsis rhabdoformis]
MVLPSKMPQLADLDLLLSVESYGSVGKAAQAHSLSQPAASIRISAMERRLGLRLLERSPAGSKLTEDGEMLAKYARNVMHAARELLEFGSGARSSEEKRLRVAGSPAISEHLIPEWLNRLGSSFGEARVEVRTGNVDTLHQLIRESHVDLAFIDGWCHAGSQGPHHFRDEMVTRFICEDRLAVVVGSRHPWAVRSTPVPVRELAAEPLVLRERGSGLREFTDELLGIGGGPGGYVEFPSTSAIKQTVANSRRVTVLNLSAVQSELAEGRLHRVAVDREMPAKPLYAAWSERRGLPECAVELVEIAASKGTPVPVIGPGRKPREAGSRKRARPRNPNLAMDVRESIA